MLASLLLAVRQVVNFRVLVAMTEQGVSDRIYVACYQADSGRLLWHRVLCELPGARPGEPELAESLRKAPVVLTLDGSVVYCNTNRGVVAALRVQDGRLQWMVGRCQRSEWHPWWPGRSKQGRRPW